MEVIRNRDGVIIPVLIESVRNWRNVYGAPLSVNGQPAGKVSFDNPQLSVNR